MRAILPVLLCGGSGTRLWPVSRQDTPKQFHALCSEKTLLQETARRFDGDARFLDPLVICNEAHRFIVAEQLREAEVEPLAVLLEPVARDTAAAVAIACHWAEKHLDQDVYLLVLPCDHYIGNAGQFREAIVNALPLSKECIVTFGVTADHPSDQYGYIVPATPLHAGYRVERFVEKPASDHAEQLLKGGDCYWNAGIFLFQAKRMLGEMQCYQPVIHQLTALAIEQAHEEVDFTRLPKAIMNKCPALSIDYAIMEKTRWAAMAPLDVSWSDIGSWQALHTQLPKDAQDNVIHGDVAAQESSGCLLWSDGPSVCAIGLEDLCVVASDDAVLVSRREQSHTIKAMLDSIKHRSSTDSKNATVGYRPWGSYHTLYRNSHSQVKSLMIQPGKRLSLQKHFHRAEHWVVISGTALVTRGKDRFVLRENESTYIEVGMQHRIENPGDEPLVVIEVQSGSYIGEDDILRIEDDYGRGASLQLVR